MPSPIVYFNGRYMPVATAKISILDQGVLYGHGVFDTMRAYGGTVFRLADHLDRLIANAADAGIAMQSKRLAIEQAIDGVLHRNKLADARVRVTVTAGAGGDGPMLPAKGPPNIFVTCGPLRHPLAKGYEAVIASARRSSTSRTGRLKSTNYLESLLARAGAKSKGADEAIFLTEKGAVAEGSASNIFFVRRGTLFTPSLDCGILAGVTRAVVLRLAREVGMQVNEGAFQRAALLGAEECFLTNAVIEVMPVLAVDGRTIGNGKPGEVTRRLQRAYAELVGKETGAR